MNKASFVAVEVDETLRKVDRRYAKGPDFCYFSLLCEASYIVKERFFGV